MIPVTTIAVPIPHLSFPAPAFTARVSVDHPYPARTALEEAVRAGVDLWGISLAGTNLNDAEISGARLAGASLAGTNLSRALLDDADLSGATLSRACLENANLSRANLAGAILLRSNLIGACLTDARLTGACLADARLTHANLADADLADIRADLRAVLDTSPAEVPALLAALESGLAKYFRSTPVCAAANGALIHGACLVGTIALARQASGRNADDLEPNWNYQRPAQRWFMGMRPGHAPATHPIAAITADWIREWLGERHDA